MISSLVFPFCLFLRYCYWILRNCSDIV